MYCSNCVPRFHIKYQQKGQPCMMTFLAIIQTPIISDHSSLLFSKKVHMYMEWKERRNTNDYSQMNFKSHCSKKYTL